MVNFTNTAMIYIAVRGDFNLLLPISNQNLDTSKKAVWTFSKRLTFQIAMKCPGHLRNPTLWFQHSSFGFDVRKGASGNNMKNCETRQRTSVRN